MKQLICIYLLFLFSSCKTEPDKNKLENPISHPKISYTNRSLEEIKKSGILKVSTLYSPTSYFLYKGRPMGFEYELLERFASYLDVKLEISIANDINKLIPNLNNGQVDIIAYGLAVTNERKKKVDFSDYIYLTKQVLVQKKPDNWRSMKWSTLNKSMLHAPIDLINKTVSVRQETSYRARLENLANELGGNIYIDTLNGELTTEQIIKMVADGQIKYTVADDNIAKIMASYYSILDIEVPISFSQ